MNRNASRGVAIASAVFALLAAGTAQAKEKAMKEKEMTQMVRCEGANACKGHGACAGADNACKAQNACKGKGFTEEKSAKACEEKGGKVAAAAMK
jgi:hypothetical protein